MIEQSRGTSIQRQIASRLRVASMTTSERFAADLARKKREDMTMNNQTMRRALVIAVAGATALGAVTPAWSAPVLSSTSAVKAAAPSALSDVRYRGQGYRRNNGAGIALGVLGAVGAVAAASAYRHNSYGYGYPGYYRQGFGGPYYGPTNYGYGNAF